MANAPIRCFTCGKTIGHLLDKYLSCVEGGEDEHEMLDKMRIGRECCRRMFLSYVDTDEFLGLYPVHPGRIQTVGRRVSDDEVSSSEGDASDEEDENGDEEMEDVDDEEDDDEDEEDDAYVTDDNMEDD